MISSLSLKNWRTHKDTQVNFGRGTNLVIGIMGSGKSALLDALSYALFGAFPQLRRRETSLFDAISYDEEEAEVALSFSHSGKDYRVVRRLKKKQASVAAASKLMLLPERKVLESGPKRVTEAISKILEVDYDLFTRAIYSEQNNIDYFLTIDPGKRKKEMDRLLGLERVESARSAAVSLLNRISGEAESLSPLFSPQEYESLTKEKANKNSSLEAISQKLPLLESECTQLHESASSLSRKLIELESLGKKSEALRSSLERSKARVEVLSRELEGKAPSGESLQKKREALSALLLEKKSLDSKLSKTEESISAISRKAGKSSTFLEAASSSARELEKLRLELESLSPSEGPDAASLLEKKEEELLCASSEAKSLAAEIPELEDTLRRLKPGSSRCPLCDSSLSSGTAENLLAQKGETLSAKKSRLESLNEKIPRLRKEKSGLASRIQKMQQVSSQIAQHKARADTIPALKGNLEKEEAELSLAKKEKSSFLLQRDECAGKHSDALVSFREEEALLKKAQSLEEAKAEASRAASELSGLQFNPNELAKLRGQSQETRLTHTQKSSELLALKKDAAMLSEQLSSISMRISKLEGLKDERAYLLKLKEELQIYRNSLLELQGELRMELTSAINSAMNNIWPILYPYADYKELRIVAREKDYTFEINDGQWRRLENIASGGEKACLSLTLRMALSTVLTPNVGWMMLDEPTHNLDAEAIHTLSEALENKVPEIIPQSIVITHEENLISSEFARSYKFSRDKERLGATVAEAI
ncbi:SMC family ATPase [Candidatus Micrarchaeota archaeon]|nr:SMC family ATPase [Candidatus Micrarchaeota archaeon]